MFALSLGKYVISKSIMWWILGSAAAGVAVYAATSESEKKMFRPLNLVLMTRGPKDPERFQDPIYECVGTGPGSALEYRWRIYANDKSVPVIMGYEYLSGVPNSGVERVKAMRAKIAAYRAAVPRVAAEPTPRAPLDIYKYTSGVNLESASAAISKFVDYRAIMEAMPVTTEVAKEKAKSIAATLKTSDAYVTVEKAAKEIPPVAIAAGKGVLKAIGIVSNDELSDEEKVIAGAHLAADVVAMVPVYGAIVSAVAKFALSFWDTQMAEDRAEADEKCRAAKLMISDLYKKTADYQYPFPWHLQETFDPSCSSDLKQYYGKATIGQWWIISVLQRNFLTFDGSDTGMTNVNDWIPSATDGKGNVTGPEMMERLGIGPKQGLSQEQRTHVKRWWATATMYMGNPNVSDVFDALGRDAWGGIVASDEQVMLVAAPIAVSHGWDVDDFAAALYDYSAGWRGEPSGHVRRRFREYAQLGAFNMTSGFDDEIRNDGAGCTDTSGAPLVRNAWWLNWTALARDAFFLAATYVPKKKTSTVMLNPGITFGGTGGAPRLLARSL